MPLVIPLLLAARRLLASAELLLRMQHGVVMERERRVTLVEVTRALPAGGAVVQFDAGSPLWAVWVPGGAAASPPALRGVA